MTPFYSSTLDYFYCALNNKAQSFAFKILDEPALLALLQRDV